MTEVEPPSILLSEEECCAVITLNRPAQLNCLTRTLMSELAVVIERLSQDAELKVLIVTGAEGIFSAGADLNEVAALDPATAYRFSREGQAILSAIGRAAPVTIAAINGYCLGGGLDLALSCDLRFAAPHSTFQHPGARRGIMTGWGGTQQLPRLIGVAATRRLLITGDRMQAGEAHRLGLINRIEDDPLTSARRFARQVAQRFTRENLRKWIVKSEK